MPAAVGEELHERSALLLLREKVPDTPLPPLTALSLPRSGMARQFGWYVPQPDDLSLAPS